MNIILSILYCILFLWIIKKSRFFIIDRIPFKILGGIFIVKVLSGFFLILIYTYYYSDQKSGDIHKYFSDGNILFSALFKNPLDYLKMLTGIGSDSPYLMEYYDKMGFWIKNFNYNLYNDNRTVIRFNAFVRLFSFESIYVHTIIMNFMSFAGLTAILKIFYTQFKNYKYILLFSIYLIPSVLLWSSGLLKEGILMFAFGFFFYFSIKLTKQLNYKLLTGIIVSMFILLISKFYILLAAIPGYISYLVLKRWSSRYALLKVIGIHIIFFLFAFNLQYLLPKYNLAEIVSKKQYDFTQMIESQEHVGSYYEIPTLEPTTLNFLKNSPIAFYNTLMRPYITESNSLMMLIASLENLLIIFSIIISILFFTRKNFKEPIIFYLISFVVIEFILCGLTTPVIGALVRYKMPALPFLMILLMYFTNFEKIKTLLKKYKIINYE